MPFGGLLTAGIVGAGALGGVLSNRRSARTSTQQGQYSSTTTPTESPEAINLRNVLIQRMLGRLNQPTPLGGYEAQGIGNINDTFRQAALARENALTSRGLSTSPIAGNADVVSNLARAGQIAQFQNTLPLLSRDLENQDLDAVQRLYALLPRTVTQSGTSSGTAVGPGSPWGAGFTNASDTLAFLFGMGALGSGRKRNAAESNRNAAETV